MNEDIIKDVYQCIDTLRDLWPHERNSKPFQTELTNILNNYYIWHKKYAALDTEKRGTENSIILKKSLNLLQELSVNLSEQSIPWPSPHYLAHMNTDIFIPSCLAYFTTMLYNPNNVTPEASPVTTILEYELSDAFCHLFGFNAQTAWAHLSSGGHASNYEAIWIARNLKRVPYILKEIPQLTNLLEGITEKEYINLSPTKIAQWLKYAKEQNLLSQILNKLSQPIFCPSLLDGQILVANGRHYAWDKCADLLGLQLDLIDLDDSFRIDINHLTQKIQHHFITGTPIVAVVATVGSSGEGSVDEIDEIIKLKKKFEEELGCSFYIHVDAAFGGYYRSLLVPPSEVQQGLLNIQQDLSILLKPEVKNALIALQDVDSITVDPHKCGYAPYPAGCLAIRDRFYSSVISIKSKYFDQADGAHMDFGPHTLEGARPGASVASVWISHRLLGFHNKGYGILLAGNIIAANKLHQIFNSNESKFQQDCYYLRSIYSPDLSILNLTLQPLSSDYLHSSIDTLNKQFVENLNQKNTHQRNLPWLSKNIIQSDKLIPHITDDSFITVIRCCIMKNLSNRDLEIFTQQCRSHYIW